MRFSMSTIELYLNQLNPAFKLTQFLQDPFNVFVSAFKCVAFIDGPVYRTTTSFVSFKLHVR